MIPDLRNLERQYRDALIDDVLPFWEKHSLDTKEGGYFSFLARDGSVYDTEKFIWPQCRQLWLFSMLCTRLERRDGWLRIAEHGYRFLRAHGRDAEGNWYFALMRDGTPLVQPYNIFSDCFAAMAFSRYAEASGDTDAGKIALNTYRNILARLENPKGKYSKIVPGSRPLRAFAIPMILINLVPEMERLLAPEEVRETIGRCVRDMTGLFLDAPRGLFFEHMAPDGSHADCPEGRLINPGHGIEGTWFLMDAAVRTGDRDLIGTAVDTLLTTLRFGWDGEYGGIFAFLDAEGKPPQQLEWDQKFWWVHVEALVALAMGYRLTRRDDCMEWLIKVHEYTWSHFPDPEYGEWFGYLDRRGDVLTPLKGGKWKGCFHIPRGALSLCGAIPALRWSLTVMTKRTDATWRETMSNPLRAHLLALIFAAGLLLSPASPAQETTTVSDALRRASSIEIPGTNIPVERTVAETLLAHVSPGARIETVSMSAPPRAGAFRVRVIGGEDDTSAGWFTFRIAPDGTGELASSRSHLLYAALCIVLEERAAEPLSKYATSRKEYVRLPWLEGNDGLFVGVPRYIRNYDPASTVRELARLGCSHVPVNVLAATQAAEQGVPGEDYPRFYVYSPDIDQFVETELTRGLYPQEYLQANLALLRKNAALARAYGLTPGLTVCSPRTMPEAFFTKYPYLRGARVDHPFRSFRPRFTATLSHPLVRWHYAQLMKNIMKEVPQLGYLTLWTNDSGSGFEYVSKLYAGRNGGAYLVREWKSDSVIARAAGENVVRYLRLLRDAASETNPRFRVITSLSYFGSEKGTILNGLGDRLDLQVGAADSADRNIWSAILARRKNGPELFGSVRVAPNFVLGVPCPWLAYDRLNGRIPGTAHMSVTFDPPSLARWSVNREIVRAYQTAPGLPADSVVVRAARSWCGPEAAPPLVEAWHLADRAVRSFPDVPLYGSEWAFPWYRHWVRPFVPDIERIPESERAYYERHMIASFNNPTRVDFGADVLWTVVDRNHAVSIVRTSDSLVWGPLDSAIRILDSMIVREGMKPTAAVLLDQRDRLVAFRCYSRTLRNVAGWVAGVHGYIGAGSAGEREAMLRGVRETIDDELKNTEDLYRLWTTTHTDFMPVASLGESWALYGENFGDLLLKKMSLMKEHRNDLPAIDPDFMWRVGPGVPVSPKEYLRY